MAEAWDTNLGGRVEIDGSDVWGTLVGASRSMLLRPISAPTKRLLHITGLVPALGLDGTA